MSHVPHIVACAATRAACVQHHTAATEREVESARQLLQASEPEIECRPRPIVCVGWQLRGGGAARGEQKNGTLKSKGIVQVAGRRQLIPCKVGAPWQVDCDGAGSAAVNARAIVKAYAHPNRSESDARSVRNTLPW